MKVDVLASPRCSTYEVWFTYPRIVPILPDAPEEISKIQLLTLRHIQMFQKTVTRRIHVDECQEERGYYKNQKGQKPQSVILVGLMHASQIS